MKPIFGVETIVACVVLGALPAKATVIDIGVATQTGPNTAFTTEATGTGSSGASLSLFAYDNFLITAAASDPSPINLESATLNVSGGSSSPLYVYVTETGLVSTGSALNFQSPIRRGRASGWSETETTYVSALNSGLRRYNARFYDGIRHEDCRNGGGQRRSGRLDVLCHRGVRVYLKRPWARRIRRECPGECPGRPGSCDRRRHSQHAGHWSRLARHEVCRALAPIIGSSASGAGGYNPFNAPA